MERLYFETSAVNYLYDNIFSNSEYGSLATRELQISKDRYWHISHVVLIEIFMTKNKERRDNLFDFSRCLFCDKLISSPEELIINYIENKCPKLESKYNISSKSLFSAEWMLASNNLDYYFEPDINDLNARVKIFQTLSTVIIKGFKNSNRMFNLKITKSKNNDLTSCFIQYIKNEVCNYFEIDDEQTFKYAEISLAITTILLCYWTRSRCN